MANLFYILLLLFPLIVIGNPQTAPAHFHSKGKMPSNITQAKQALLKKQLPFDDIQDFKEQSRGFIAKPDYEEIAFWRER